METGGYVAVWSKLISHFEPENLICLRAAPGVEPCTFDLEERAAEEQSVRFLDIKVWICGGSLNVSNWCKPEPDFGALIAL